MEEWFALVQSALSALPRPSDTAEMLHNAGLLPAEWDMLVSSYLCEPPPSVDLLAEWLPYTAPQLCKARLTALLEKGFLQALNEQECLLTDRAVELIETWVERKRAQLAAQAPLPWRDLRQLAHLLSRIVQAALAAPPPPHKIHLLGNQRLAPSADAAPMMHIDQSLTDLLWFRDDAHIAAWREHGFDGPSIEVLTLVWRGEATDLDGLSAMLSEQRGYSRQDYARVVARLQARDFVHVSAAELSVTPAGRAVREEIESTTDRYFMFPWTALLPIEVRQLRDLLQCFVHASSAPFTP
nr:hypothetical protein [Chloroflexota bacterium]